MNRSAELVDAKLIDPHKTGTPSLAAMCGRGPRSSLRMLQHGLAVSEMAVSELPGNPNAVWTEEVTSSAKTALSTVRAHHPTRPVSRAR